MRVRYDDDDDIGLLSQSSWDNEMEQELTDRDTRNVEFFDRDNKQNSNMSTYMLVKMLINDHAAKWNELMLNVGMKI